MKPRVIFLLMAALCAISKAEDWMPPHYIIYKESVSPDQRFGVLISDREGYLIREENAKDNYLADLKSHRLLGKIEDACLWYASHRVGLSINWSKDSKFVLVTNDSRFGIHSISALTINPEGTGFHQVRMDKAMQHALDQVTREASKQPQEEAEAGTMYAIEGRKIHLCASGTSNPKEYDDVASFYSFFRGTYDLDREKWINTEARSLDKNEYQDISTLVGFTPSPYPISFYESSEYCIQLADQHLNEIYRALKYLAPPKKFQQLRLSQLAWLKKRDQITDKKKQNQFIVARIQELVSMNLWAHKP